MISDIEMFTLNTKSKVILPFIDTRVHAGFPSPALDYSEQRLDLNEHLIRHPDSTFVIKVTGTSMIDDGINDEDLLIVDKSIEPAMNQIVIAELNGEYTVKRIEKIKNKLYLVAANRNFDPIAINEENEFIVWGVVTFTIHKTH